MCGPLLPSRKKHEVHSHIKKNVELGSKFYTDDFNVYDQLPEGITREFVNHLNAYVEGRVHTNGLENFWTLLKRGLRNIGCCAWRHQRKHFQAETAA